MRVSKEIKKLKLSLTQECCLRCTHCFVDKAGRLTISAARAGRGLELFLSSPGKDKKLELAGGEVFIRFPLLRAVTDAAMSLARRHKKNLEIWVASNGLLLNTRHLKFIRERGIVLSISLYGTLATHDAIRTLPQGRGSFLPLKRKVRHALSELDPNRVTALLCAHPAFAAALYDDYTGILDMGFKVVNIECVHGIPWPAQSFSLFKKNLGRIIELTRRRILAGEFVVFENFIQLIRSRAGAAPCPLRSDLEIYPDGSLSLYPYGFVDIKKHGSAIKVGNVEEGLNARFSACAPGCGACRSCVSDYYRLPGMSGGAASYAFRTETLADFFHEMVCGPEKTAFRPYIKKLIGVYGHKRARPF